MKQSEEKSDELAESTSKDLRLQLKEKDGLAKGYLSRLQWLQAEFENYKKRVMKEKKEIIEYANEKLVTQLLDILDNLERAIESTKKEGDKKSVINGIEMTYKQFRDILKKEGLIQIKAIGEPFDPFKHEAVMRVSSNDLKDGAIVGEIQKGYLFNSKVIRPSKVKVIKNP